VFAALADSLDAGRRRLSRIVGRDTARLDAQQVRTAVLETMAENLNDGVVAPLFWFALLGLPGMMAFKMINTLDSMIAHRDARYEWFGKTAARLDDAANLVPARLTALLQCAAAGSVRGLRFVARYGRAHASPNSGYPEAALAGILDVRFGGPHTYDGELVEKPWIGRNPRAIGAGEIGQVVANNHAVAAVAVLLAAAVWLFVPIANLFS
jgi:adenosylcobinamide-phosphate synthase